MARNVKQLGVTARRHAWKAIALGLALVLAILAAPGTEAHKGITSKYNYNEHVFPILRDRCGRCHVEGGPTPMSLMKYADAVPWAESIREQLVSQKMPPWYADPTGPAVRGGHTISTKELDMLVTWAAGGTPQSTEKTFIGVGTAAGDASAPAAPAPNFSEWKSGPPDLTVKMEAEHTLPPGKIEDSAALTLTTGLKEPKWVKAVDLMPGTPSMVRDAVISVENGPVLAAWVPGHDAVAPPSGVAFKLPAGAKLRLDIHYKKHWQDEQNAKSDLSTIGLYFTEAPLSDRSVETVTVTAPDANGESSSPDQPRTFTGTFKTAARVVGLRPSFDQAYAKVDIDAVLPAGRRVTLLKLRAPQPQWYRRYWLQEPIELPAGSKIEVAATPAPPDDFGIPVPKRYPLQVGVEYVAQ